MKVFNLKIISCNVMWRELCFFSSKSRNKFSFQFMPFGLHSEPDQLRNEVQKAINASGDSYDAIILGYGLCSKGVEGITAMNVPLVITKSHDCITCFLGSRQRYREYFDANPGTYWYTPGWIENHLAPGRERYEVSYKEYLEKYGEENAKYLMDMEHDWYRKYSTAAYVDLGIGDTTDFKEYTHECATWLNWKFEKLDGDASLIQKLVSGDWDNDDFLVVEPGYRIESTNDENIFKSVPAGKNPEQTN